MSYYLLDNPPASPQYRNPRREPLSGCVVLHTAEGGHWVPPENVASFISNRPDPGSYHVILGPTDTLDLIPESMEAFHVAADGHNRHSVGVCFSTSAHLWNLGPKDDAALHRAAKWIAGFALRWADNDPTKARQVARIITRDQALAHQPGITLHGLVQPADRSDAWLHSPHRAELERRIVSYTLDLLEDDMPTTEEIVAALRPVIKEEAAAAVRPMLTKDSRIGKQLDRIEGTLSEIKSQVEANATSLATLLLRIPGVQKGGAVLAKLDQLLARREGAGGGEAGDEQ